MVFLLETKMKGHGIEGVRRRMGFHKGFDVRPNGVAEGQNIWWNDPVEVIVKLLTKKKLIHTEIRIIEVCDWFQALWIYGNPYRAEKVDF